MRPRAKTTSPVTIPSINSVHVFLFANPVLQFFNARGSSA